MAMTALSKGTDEIVVQKYVTSKEASGVTTGQRLKDRTFEEIP